MSEVRTTSSTGGQKGTKDERFDLIPTGPLAELARHYGAGAKKYEDHQWRKGYEWSKSYAAIQRHLNAFWGGEDYDVCPYSIRDLEAVFDDPGCLENHPETGDLVIASSKHGRTCYNHTGNHHMAAVSWHAFALLEFKDKFPEHDDRYKDEPASGDR